MSERIMLKYMDGTVIGEFEDFDHAVRALGEDFVMAGNYLLESAPQESGTPPEGAVIEGGK